MNKRELMLDLLDSSRTPETIPAAFFLHFDPAFHRGQAAVDKHLEFFRTTGMDFVKIQFEHPMPRLDIKRPEDWSKVPLHGLDFYDAPLRVVEGLVKAVGKEALVLVTLYSPFMLAGQIGGPETVVRHAEEKPEAFKRGIAAITEGLLGFVRECIRRGLDGFYSSTQGGEKGRFPHVAAFNECVRPYDLTIMKEINSLSSFNILHVCDYHLPYTDLAPFTDYPGHIVNTSLQLAEGTTSAREVARVFNRPFMGGLERKGVIATGSAREIKEAVRAVLKDAPSRFVLGADCTVPPDTSWENLRIAIETAHEYRR
jgi:uroporphyrinogen decarboxylase